jgi:hypothetical protein
MHRTPPQTAARGRALPADMRARRLLLLCAVALPPGACTDRDLVEESGESGELEPGEQPQAPGAMYAPCKASTDCPGGLCVFPTGEAGYCSASCGAAADAARCAPPPGDQPPTCLDIGLPSGEPVCALDCAAAPCPVGMRCEGVRTGGGEERSICF